MLTISASALDDTVLISDDMYCQGVDAATIAQAVREQRNEAIGCQLEPAWAVFINPADDITIPVYLCTVHFNAFKYGLKTGTVGLDLDVFGD